jgi:hypothetical protein
MEKERKMTKMMMVEVELRKEKIYINTQNADFTLNFN